MSRKLTVITGVCIAVAALAAVGFAWLPDRTDKPLTITAQFEDAVGLYEGNIVSVLGMPVGKVTSIVSKGGYVEVKLDVDSGIDIPADAQAVTLNTSLLTDRHVELTPPYHGGPKMKVGDIIGLGRTRTPVEFDRSLASLDKLLVAMRGDGKGQGPLADFIAVTGAATLGNGATVKSTLEQLSQALRLGADNGAHTKEEIQAIVNNLSELSKAAAKNDDLIREFGSNLHQVSDIVADENLGTGDTGKKVNQILEITTNLLESNRDKIKGTVNDAQTVTKALVDYRRELAESFDLTPLLADNVYNTIDKEWGALRGHAFPDKILFDGTLAKEICNILNRKQLGCATGTALDYGPDFGLGMMLDLMAGKQP
jgi:virulence factor Mce-like protein